MTLVTSLNNGVILRHSLKHAARAALVPSFLSFIALFLAVVASNRLIFNPEFRQYYKFFLYDSALSPLVTAIIIGGAAVSAITTFMFLYQKNAVTVYFSLGLTRRKLFLTRYLAGLMISAAPVILVMFTAYIANMIIFDASSELTTAFFYLLSGFFILGLAVFTITSLLCICCGTLAEGVLFSAWGLGGVSLVLLGLNFLIKVFLFGNPYGVFSNFYQVVEQNIVYHATAINPLLFFLRDAAALSGFGLDWSRTSPVFAVLPEFSIITVSGWLAASILLALAALMLFERRKAEISGFVGANRWVSFICTFIPTFFVFTLAAWVANEFFNRTVAVAIAAISGLAVYALSEIIFRQTPFRHNSLKLPAAASICLLCIVTLSSGGLGFTGRLPAPGEIESAYISYKGSPDYHPMLGGATSSINTYAFRLQDLAYTAPAEIAKVLDIHRAIIAYGDRPASREGAADSLSDFTVENEILIKYRLKDGSDLIRHYRATSAANLVRVLHLDETEHIKSRIDHTLTDDQSVFAVGDIFLTDIFYTHEYEYLPGGEARSRLLEALRADLAGQTVDRRYFPEKPALGMLIFTDRFFDESHFWRRRYSILEMGIHKIFITEDLTRTVAFLAEENLLDHFATNADIDYLTVERYVINPKRDIRFITAGEKFHYFRSFNNLFGNVLSSPATFTDPAEQEELMRKIRTNYFAVEGGYIVGVHIKDRAPVYLFLPEKDAPAFIRNL